MYSNFLNEKEVLIDDIFLDPNNPRFFEEGKRVALSKYTNDKIQKESLKSIQQYNIEELVNSILINGFLPMDRVVVKKIEGQDNKYFVLEGNRRISAIKTCISRHENGEIDETEFDDDYLDTLIGTLKKLKVLEYSGSEEDISWMLQGIRHISGIKDWSPTQRAKLILDQIESKGKNFTGVGKQFGLSAKAVGSLYRGYKGLQQMERHPELGYKAKNDYFSLFEQAYKNKDVRVWMQWNDSTYAYENEDNFRQFCEWISPDEDNVESGSNGRRVHDPKHVRYVGNLVNRKRDDLISEVDNFEVSIEQAWGRAEETKEYDWKTEVLRAEKAITNIPYATILKSKEDVFSSLKKLRDVIESMISI
ncbi:hypothetical protein Q4530_01150 [Colwellia sp. 1_MG-2023]|uniref:hypothetical protein n=1 Tax=unclassified Colwellia TaxID=196834 RepID=UPI001C085B6F|nr:MULTISPECIES: hypothetical protein [unclassified Colwellia]MBU2925799.1 hypothetical protein [Colwellia sp. C2M11]MDO6650974.1 hypothetical protein [Colwellia sp. 3_MG-2023]MDO6664009.1 hypothetical protein [Colwellia sp. 2_MG-2023]MDO6688360.1 hypothetical protein [Colwellia sp. 1_MG-2023]